MINFKDKKGVTLLGLLIYILLTLTALAMLTVISAHFRDNLRNVDSDTLKDSEFDKINLQLLQEFRTENNFLDTEQTTNTKIVFSNGNAYTCKNNVIYLNENIKILENIELFNVELNDKFLTVTVKISGKQKDFQYAIDECIQHNYNENRICTLCGFEAGVYAILYSDGDLRFNSTGNIDLSKIGKGSTVIVQSEDISEADYTSVESDELFYGKRPWHNDKESITQITFEEEVIPDESTDYWFRELTNLKSINYLEYLNTTNVTSMVGMFQGCSNLVVLDLSSFDTSKVESMSSMFINCQKLEEINLKSFNTSNVTDFSYMFSNCTNLTEIDVRGFETSKATTFTGMFEDTLELKKIDVSKFNTSNVTTMERMFNSCSVKGLDLSSFNTSNVTNMKKMFANNDSLTKIYIGENWTTEKVDHSSIINEEQPFYGCTKLVGGAGTTFNSTNIDISYARVDGGPDSATPGYLTLIQAE